MQMKKQRQKKKRSTTARRCTWEGWRVWAQLTNLVYLSTLATQKPTLQQPPTWLHIHNLSEKGISQPKQKNSHKRFFPFFFLMCKIVRFVLLVCNISSSELSGLTPVQHIQNCITHSHKHLHLITNLHFFPNSGSFHGTVLIKQIFLCQRWTFSHHIL